MKHSIELPPVAPQTPLESEGLTPGFWYGLQRYPGGCHPRFEPVATDVVDSIPTIEDAAKAKQILADFEKALSQFNAHFPEPVILAAAREQNIVRRHALLKSVDQMDPVLAAEAAGSMRNLRREAAALGAVLCDRLSGRLREQLISLTLELESKRKEQNWPIVEHGGGEVIYHLHCETSWSESQLRYLQARAVAERLRNQRLVDQGILGEFDVLKYFLGIDGGGISPC